jgi:putative hemolysin
MQKIDKRLLTVFFIVVFAAVLALVAIWLIRANHRNEYREGRYFQNYNEQSIVGDRSCLRSGNCSQCQGKKNCAVQQKETTVDINQITATLKQLFADKYKKKIADVSVTINQATNDYARGGVKLSAAKTAEGGNFLAVKVNGSWQIIFDGNGSINCNLKEQYGFPDEMLSDCASEQKTTTNNAGIANPASVYCEEHGGKLEMVNNEAGVAGICKFSDDSSCDEWAFFRGECKSGDNK